MESKMELLVAALIGIILGGGTATGVAVAVNNKTSKAAAEAAAVAGSKAAAEVVGDLTAPSTNLTAPDLLKVACSSEHIDKHGDMLCREMFCRMQSRGIDAKTSGTECEQISNVSNKKTMMLTCDSLQEPSRKECYDFFDKRI